MSQIVEQLIKAIGADNVVTKDMAKYLRGNEQPAAVACPGSGEDVAAIVKIAAEAGVKLNVGGAVVDTAGLGGGVAIVMKRMNKILEIDRNNLTCWVQPGLSHKEFCDSLLKEGLYFPPEPYAVGSSSVGGCFGVGDPDSKSFKYMPPRTYIIAYEMVLPTGETMKIGSKCIKCVSGLDLIHFVSGSRATLGILTKILTKLLPAPVCKSAVVADMPNIAAAAKAFLSIQKRRLFVTRENAITAKLGQNILSGAKGAVAFVDIEEFPKANVEYAKIVEAELKIAGATTTKIITDPKEYAATELGWLKAREAVNLSDNKVRFTVGASNIIKGLDAAQGVVGPLTENEFTLIEAQLGKITVASANPEEDAVKLNKAAMQLGGNVSGLLGSKLRCDEYSDKAMFDSITQLLRNIRKEFDPKGILAPGVRF
ncbi:MAG: FAD-binding oxidoreductase [Gracilibacteraceae bacterium]|jgi:glycolate oxidase|nr:FAD-binding oxidoreductase [Gracilibacteraceae bacterium]